MEWTKSKPTEPGWYWYEDEHLGWPVPVHVDWEGFIEDPECRSLEIAWPEEDGDIPMFEDADGIWAGPIYAP